MKGSSSDEESTKKIEVTMTKSEVQETYVKESTETKESSGKKK